MANLSLKNINKVYPNGVQAVYDFNIDIEDGEFVVFVGPSGCGKTTTLRMIAGLEDITSGDLEIDNKRVNNFSPRERDIAMAFQNYALYGQMSVYHNMAFSLTLLKRPADEIHEKVMRAAEMLDLVQNLNRKPKQLSGGQKQRVALGRAIVRNPKVFLLDEPLSNLDVKLRDTARRELTELHRKLKATFVYVTHDQIEAMTLATRIVIMKDGVIQQIGTPSEVYSDPNNEFVASFIGSPPMNLLHAKLDNNGIITIGDMKIKLTENQNNMLKRNGYENSEITFGIRPEDIHISDSANNNSIKRIIDFVEFLGDTNLIHFNEHKTSCVAKIDSKYSVSANESINFVYDLEQVKFFDAKTGHRIK